MNISTIAMKSPFILPLFTVLVHLSFGYCSPVGQRLRSLVDDMTSKVLDRTPATEPIGVDTEVAARMQRLSSIRASSLESKLTTEMAPSYIKSRRPSLNARQSSCDMGGLNATERWEFADGSNELRLVDNALFADSLICRACYLQTKETCNSTDPRCQEGVTEASMVDGFPNVARAIGLISLDNAYLDGLPGLGFNTYSAAPNCMDCANPGIYVVLASLVTLNNLFNNIYLAIGMAETKASELSSAIQSTFAPIPASSDGFISILEAVITGMLGFIPGTAGIAANAFNGVGQAVFNNALSGTDSAPDPSQWIEMIATNLQEAYANMTTTLFQLGDYAYNTAPVSLSDLFDDGNMLGIDVSSNTFENQLWPIYFRMIVQQFAFYTWNNYIPDGVGQWTPFITFDPMPCDQVNTKGNPFYQADASVDYEGSCYYLLAGVPVEFVTPPYSVFCAIQTLPGGTNSSLQQQGIFQGLSVADFIFPSVRGWLANNKQNGYMPAKSNVSLFDDPQAAGAVQIPVCDYSNNNNAGGSGCPVLFNRNGITAKRCVITE